MRGIYTSEKPVIDILINGDQYYASIWIYDSHHHVGPAFSESELKSLVIEWLVETRLISNIKSCQGKSVEQLHECIVDL